MQVKKQQLELDKEQQSGWKLGKEYVKAVYCLVSVSVYIKKILQEVIIYLRA